MQEFASRGSNIKAWGSRDTGAVVPSFSILGGGGGGGGGKLLFFKIGHNDFILYAIEVILVPISFPVVYEMFVDQ